MEQFSQAPYNRFDETIRTRIKNVKYKNKHKMYFIIYINILKILICSISIFALYKLIEMIQLLHVETSRIKILPVLSVL